MQVSIDKQKDVKEVLESNSKEQKKGQNKASNLFDYFDQPKIQDPNTNNVQS